MRLGRFFVFALALALTGCDAWTADSQLIPLSARDSIGLAGDYTSNGSKLSVTPLGNKRYAMTIKSGETSKDVMAAFDLLRTDPVGDDNDGYSYTKYYLVEYEREGEEGKIFYAYDVVSTRFSDEFPDPDLGQYAVKCSQAAMELAAASDGGCKFSRYSDVRAAALDMLEWMDNARAEVQVESFRRPLADD